MSMNRENKTAAPDARRVNAAGANTANTNGLPTPTDGRCAALEAAVERDMALLAGLPVAGPDAGVAERIRNRMRAEAEVLQRRITIWRRAARLGGVAAAVVVAATTLLWQPARPRSADAGYDAALEDWAVAMTHSHDTLVELLLDDGIDTGGGIDETIEDFDRALSKLDELGV